MPDETVAGEMGNVSAEKRRTHGRTAGVYPALRALAVGQHIEAPRAWRYAAHSAATELGIKVTTRSSGVGKVVITRTR